MATAKDERGPAPDLVLALGVPKRKPKAPEEASEVPGDFSDAASEAFPELANDPARMSAFYDACRAAGGGLMGR
jgi:hypothetical protein